MAHFAQINDIQSFVHIFNFDSFFSIRFILLQIESRAVRLLLRLTSLSRDYTSNQFIKTHSDRGKTNLLY